MDGFPNSKEQFNAMIEHGIVPDDVIVFREENNDNEVLMNRWNKLIRNGIFPTSLLV